MPRHSSVRRVQRTGVVGRWTQWRLRRPEGEVGAGVRGRKTRGAARDGWVRDDESDIAKGAGFARNEGDR